MERVFASGIGEIVMKKLFFEIERDGFYGTYYENPTDLIVRSLVYLEMIQMITWQSVGQNGYIKME